MRVNGRGFLSVSAAFSALLFVIMLITLPIQAGAAAQITNRSLTLMAGASDGGSKPSGVVNHSFTFTVPTGGSVGSIQFLYCTTPSVASCVTPTGLSTTSATLNSQSGATGFTMVNGTNGAPYITRTAAAITASTALTYQLNTITNPSTVGQFFVRISTFTATNATGSAIDAGSVAASTAAQIVLTGTMPESIIFCAGGTISTTSGIPDCTTATSGSITFANLFSPSSTETATSQMAASTNASAGYVITVNGATMTSGSATIPAMSTATGSVVGTSQFGMNLVANTTATSTPAVGAAITAASNGTTLKGQSLTGYNTADVFKFASGDSIANSAVSGAGPTNSQIYTASYIINVSGGQLAGTYTTTLTYICTATF